MPTSTSGRRSKHRSPTERRRDREGPDGNASTASAHAAPAAPEPNLDASDPYAILGVSRTSTSQEIKLSYRKLALRHHPDRQQSDADKEAAHRHFAAIGNAYEILGDEGRRREYDDGLLRQQYQQPQRQPGSGHGGRDEFSGFGSDPFFSDPFFASPFGGSGGRSSSPSRSSAFHFTDPFELFEQCFAEEMGHHSRAHRRAARASDPFASDPFFSNDAFSDPFFSSGGSLFGRGGMDQMMSSHFDRASSMMSQMHGGSLLGDMDPQHHYASSSSAFSNRNGGQHQLVSTSTKTTIVNGVRKTVRERTVVHPDGRVDRHVEAIEGDGNDTGRLTSGSRPALDYGEGGMRSRR